MKWPILSWGDPIDAEIRAQVANRFFGLPACDHKRPGSIVASTTAEPLTDVGADGLRRISHLADVQQSAWGSVNESIDSIRCSLGSVQYIEISVGHAPR